MTYDGLRHANDSPGERAILVAKHAVIEEMRDNEDVLLRTRDVDVVAFNRFEASWDATLTVKNHGLLLFRVIYNSHTDMTQIITYSRIRRTMEGI